MKDLQEVKAIGEQLLALSVELLRRIDTDDQERAALIESVKKTPTERYFIFRGVRTRPKSRISKRRICEN